MTTARPGRRLIVGTLLLLLGWLIGLCPAPAAAHDPSAWGGIYRTRDDGSLWFLANPGRFVTAAIALAISPTDPANMLLATDSGLLRSRNAGRDWEVEAPTLMVGPVFAVAFDHTGQRALAVTATGLFATDDDRLWQPVNVPTDGLPGRHLVRGQHPGEIYLAGRRGLLRSGDWGARWQAVDAGLPDAPIAAMIIAPPPLGSWVVANGSLWRSADTAWETIRQGLPAGRIDTIALDQRRPDRLWVAGADRLFVSTDDGAIWQPYGEPLPDVGTTINGIAIGPDAASLVLTTSRGLYRSLDAANSWELIVDNVPVHLEARPLVSEPGQPTTLYAGFSVMPYEELWLRALRGGSPLAQLDPLNLAGGLALLVLFGLLGGGLLRRLGHHYQSSARAAPTTSSERTDLVLERSAQ